MDLSEQAEGHDRNFVAGIELLARAVHAGFVRTFGQIHVAATRLPVAFFNAVFVTQPLDNGIEDLRVAVALMRSEAVPFVVHVRSDLDPAADAARALGLTPDDRLPCFAIIPGKIPAPPQELEITRVDAASFGIFLDATIAAFGMSGELARALYRPRMLEAAGTRAYLGLVGGKPVATAVSLRTEEVIGIYSVATIPEARRRGYGTAMTWFTMSDADPGVRVGILQATPMGRPVYERMGFRLVREYLEFVEPARRQAAGRRSR